MFDKLFDVDVLKIIGPVGVVCLLILFVLFKMFFELFKMYRDDKRKTEERLEGIIKENRDKFGDIYSNMAGVVERNTAETAKNNTTMEFVRQELASRPR